MNYKVASRAIRNPILDVPYYEQTAEFTCGPACALMLLQHFNHCKASRELEFEIWREVNLIGVPGCDSYSLALGLSKRGLGVRIFVEGELMPDRTLIERRFGEGSAKLTLFALKHAIKRCIELGLPVEKRLPTGEEIVDALKNGVVPVFMVYMHGAPHWIVVKGTYRNGYVVSDPYYTGGGSDVNITLKRFENSIENLKLKTKINPNCLFVCRKDPTS